MINDPVDNEPPQTIVIDNGASMIKCGLSGPRAPFSEFPTLVGRSRSKPPPAASALSLANTDDRAYVGDILVDMRGLLVTRSCIHRSRIIHWDDIIHVWHHALANELNLKPNQHPVGRLLHSYPSFYVICSNGLTNG
jgi:actin-related protein